MPRTKKLRRYVYTRVAGAIALSGLLSALGVALSAELVLRKIDETARREILDAAYGGIRLLDIVVAREERDMRAACRAALLDLGSRIDDAGDFAAYDAADLRALAEAYGVSELYLVGPDGRIEATSFEPDLGLDLFALSGNFSKFLRGLVGKGEVEDQRIAGSTMTGTLSFYQYYSPKGSDIILEASIEAERAFGGSYEGLGFRDLVGLAFPDAGARARPGKIYRIVDLLYSAAGHPASMLGIPLGGGPKEELFRRAMGGLPAKARRGGVETSLLPLFVSPRGPDFEDIRYWAVLEYDTSYLSAFRGGALALTALYVVLAALCAFLASKRAFDRAVGARIERLETAMAAAALGDYRSRFHDGGDDEISSMERSLDAMVDTMSGRTARLEWLNARLKAEAAERASRERELARSVAEKEALLREVHHRVKNNLQVITSLVSLQIGAEPDLAAAAALGRMRSRLLGMALVHDQLYGGDSVASVDMGAYLRGLAADRAFLAGGPPLSVAVEDGCGGLPPDLALPIGLAATELFMHLAERLAAEGRTGSVAMAMGRRGGAVTLDVSAVFSAAEPGTMSPLPRAEPRPRPGREAGPERLALEIAGALAAQLRGGLSSLDEGWAYRLEAPLPETA